MNVSRLIAAVVAAVLVAAGSIAPAQACKCAQIPYDKVVRQTPVVFDGEVVRSEHDTRDQQQITSFRVRGAVKGVSSRLVLRQDNVFKRTPQRTITVISAVSDAECGYDFSAGPQRLIVGADRNADGNLVATRCTIYNLNASLMEDPK
jgi:hypothetical protein